MLTDPESLEYEDLVELVRTFQETLWPKGDADQEWSSDTTAALAGAMNDAGLGPDDPDDEDDDSDDPDDDSDEEGLEEESDED